MGTSSQLPGKDTAISSSKSCSSNGPFVYGFTDLFCGNGESWHWALEMDEKKGLISSVESHTSHGLEPGLKVRDNGHDTNPKPIRTEKQQVASSAVKLDPLKEETEDDKSVSASDTSSSLTEDIIRNGMGCEEDFSLEQHGEEDQGFNLQSESWETLSSSSLSQASQSIEKDVMVVHLLRLACASKGPFSDNLQEIISELSGIGIFSEWVRDLASKPSPVFNKIFDNVFHRHMVSSKVSQFWQPVTDLGGPSTSLPSSRYHSDFEELKPLGHGGFGHVVLCQNKLDGRQYAMKKIRLKDKSSPINDRILREVTTLSRLQHQHVVRYYQAWFEKGVANFYRDNVLGSATAASSMFSHTGAGSIDVSEQENKLESTYLYIQMEYCPRTLRQVFESYNHFDKELAWHLFRQIVEGLAHIHSQGIIHRDLTPNNIFFDARNDIKIGDFGLAKFLRFEQVDQEVGVDTDTVGVSLDGTGQVGTYFYTAPEIEQGWPKIDEKADMYSLGVVFFELWHPFGTAMERHVVLSDLKLKGELPAAWVAEFPEQASLLRRLMSQSPSDRPSATELLQNAFPPKMEYKLLDNMLRTMQSSEDRTVYDKVVNAIFDEEILKTKNHHLHVIAQRGSASAQFTDVDTEIRDYVSEVTREVFKKHCAKHLEIVQMHLLEDCQQFNRNTVKLLTHGGDMLELCYELRLPFASWIVANQKSSLKRYEISSVYRRAIGHSPPNHYLQGDFDIIGGVSILTEAELLKITMDTLIYFFHLDCCDIRLNHADLLEAIWSWAGIRAEHRHKVAELLSIMGPLRPQSPERKSKWVVIRRQLLQELKLPEATVNRLQTVGLRFCEAAEQALPRLRGALPTDKLTRKALDELAGLFNYLRVWKIEKHVYIDPLMPPIENYHRDLFFQIYLVKDNHPGSLAEGGLLAVGGRYDYMIHQMWDNESKTNPPGAVGASLALETIIQHCPIDHKPIRNHAATTILVCSRGGGGLLVERMELVAELWEENIKAELVPVPDPSLTEQYEYASEHDIKCLVIMTDVGVSQTGFVKVRYLDPKREKDVERENLVRFLLDAIATQFRNPAMWI